MGGAGRAGGGRESEEEQWVRGDQDKVVLWEKEGGERFPAEVGTDSVNCNRGLP